MIRFFIISLAFFVPQMQAPPGELIVQSTAFANTHYIPYRYTCDGENVSPGLRITKIPSSAKSLALIMVDSSAAFGIFDHWVVWNIPVAGRIEENGRTGITGRNSRKENKYMGPCPPNGLHEYRFRIYALDVELNLPDTAGKRILLRAMQGHILAKGELIGLFQRQ